METEPENITNVPALVCTKGKKAPAAPATRGIRYWLADTGCPADLVSEKTLPKDAAACIEVAAVEQNFDTANGELKADRTVRMQIEGLDDDCDLYVLADTPDVISIGRRCVQLGYGFHWDPWSKKAYFTRPVDQGGGKLQLVSIGDVHYLADSINKTMD